MASRASLMLVLGASTVSCLLYQGCSGGSFGSKPLVKSLAITTTSPLPAGSVGVAYSDQFAATGGTAPFQWSLASGSTLPAGLALSSSGLLAGTPTALGVNTFSIRVTDSAAVPATATQSFTLTISGGTNVARLNGDFAFEFSGFNAAGAIVAGGSFHADGSGNISTGVEDFTTTTGHTNQTFSGSYSLGSDNRGMLVFASLPGSPAYAFAIDSSTAHGRLIEFDATGTRGSGQLEKQGLSVCAFNSITGEYAVGITGNATSAAGFGAGPVVMAGRFTATPPGTQTGQGSIGNGEMDANTPGSFPLTRETVFGSYQSTSQTARCAATISPQSLPSMNFSVYPVSATEFFLVETDAISASTPLLMVGTLIQQVGFPFSGPAVGFTANSVGGLTGQFFSGGSYVPDVAIAALTATGSSGFSLAVVENQAGTIKNFSGASNFVGADSFGRVATNLVTPIDPIFYMINQSEAFVIGEIFNNPFLGIMLPQSSGPFTASAIKGSFAQGTSFPVTNAVHNLSGVLALDGVQAVTGTQDLSTTSGNMAGQSVSGTYTISNSTAGFGSITLTTPANFAGSFYLVSPTQFVLVSTTSGDANPVLIFAQQ